MIIPKAIFLQQSYLKNLSDLQTRLNHEYALAMSRIVGALRQSQNHKLGRLSVSLPTGQFPLLTAPKTPGVLNEICSELRSAGYAVDVDSLSDGIVFRLDWTGELPLL